MTGVFGERHHFDRRVSALELEAAAEWAVAAERAKRAGYEGGPGVWGGGRGGERERVCVCVRDGDYKHDMEGSKKLDGMERRIEWQERVSVNRETERKKNTRIHIQMQARGASPIAEKRIEKGREKKKSNKQQASSRRKSKKQEGKKAKSKKQKGEAVAAGNSQSTHQE